MVKYCQKSACNRKGIYGKNKIKSGTAISIDFMKKFKYSMLIVITMRGRGELVF